MKTRPGTPVRRRLRSAGGFGLLEAIVALALLAGTGLALFSWIQQSLRDATRLRQHDLEARLLLSAQALIETTNPMLQAQGSVEVGDLRATWHAEAVEPERSNVTFVPGVAGPFRIGLYRMHVHARDDRQGIEVRFEQWQVGTQRDAVPQASPL